MAETTQATQKSLLRSTISVDKIQKSVSSFGKSLNSAQKTSLKINTTLSNSNKSKRESLAQDRISFQRRREAVRRREQEDIVEASGIGGAIKRQGKVIGSSTKGFLGRILDFIGTLLVGWMINNLPMIINLAQQLITRIQKLVGILGGFIQNMTNIFSGFGTLLNGVFSSLMTFDFSDQNQQITRGLNQMQMGFMGVEQNFNQAINLLSEPLDLGFDELDFPNIPKQREEDDGTDTGEPSTTTAPPPPGQRYNISQLVGLAQRVGFRGENAAVAAAVAYAESTGNTRAHNKKPPDNSYGLWQINMLGSLGPERRRTFGISSNDELFDPVTNAKAAFKVSGGSNFSPWTMYKNGEYLKFLPAARESLKSPQAPPKPASPVSVSTKTQLSPLTGTSGSSMGNKPLSTPLSPFSPEKSGPITSGFGYRWGRIHRGYDVGVPEGTPVYAYFPGTVTRVGYEEQGYGYYIEWKDDIHNQIHFFGHLNQKPAFSKGTKFAAGTQLASSGNTGRSTAPHLHWEIGPQGSQIDPGKWLRSVQAKPSGLKLTTTPSAQISTQDSKQTTSYQELSQDRKGQLVLMTLPPSQMAPQATMPQGGGGVSIPSSDEIPLNRMIAQKLLLDLAYT